MKLFGMEKMLRAYARRKPLRLHMPGHKAARAFRRRFPVAAADITELCFSDSLQQPEGVIAAAERRVAEILGAKKSFFLTDGSTCGVFSMLYAVKARGGEVVVNRNAHQSVYNACKVLGVEPVILSQNTKDGILLPPEPRELERALAEHPAADALLTYPDYYGQTFDLSAMKKICAARGRLLLLDGAHGGHFRFYSASVYAGEYADIWVDGVHKTLPCLTQTAVLNVNDGACISVAAEAVKIFRTSSPSYPLMASIEYGEEFMAKEGARLLSSLEKSVSACKRLLLAHGYGVFDGGDALKLCVDFAPTGISPFAAEEILHKKGIYAEMNDGRRLLFLLGVSTTKRQLRRLTRALIAVRKLPAGAYTPPPAVKTGVKATSCSEACAAESERVPLRDAVGRTLAENVGLFPPCCPLCVAGETMTEAVAETLEKAQYSFGAEGGKVKVVKKG
ncbi:MAG: hypothetical protein DBX59_02640 [Bacillota bacterium]|nr:MAG: hypothetical protein DBX59_02640 [Bacillota bacterium]